MIAKSIKENSAEAIKLVLAQCMADGFKVWSVPSAGFFTNAELARATKGKLEMHNVTNMLRRHNRKMIFSSLL